jgi:hypothetical protein
MNVFRISAAFIAISFWTVVCELALADPLPGEILKFQQLPLNNGAPVLNPVPPVVGTNPTSSLALFPGHDETSTAYVTAVDPGTGLPDAWTGTYMADDFADKFNTPVVHVRWWGSYANNFLGANNQGVQRFLISFESDVPGTTAPSHPGSPLLNQFVTKGVLAPSSGTFTENLISPASAINPLALYQYNADLKLPFSEQPNTVYWLKIVALAPNDSAGANISWGWHDRDWSIPDVLASMPPLVSPGEGVIGFVPNPVNPGTTLPVNHFQDDAVQGAVSILSSSSANSITVQQTGFTPQHYIDGVDGPVGISQFSKDLAFELYTVPEPSGLVLLGLGAGLLAARKWLRRPAGTTSLT